MLHLSPHAPKVHICLKRQIYTYPSDSDIKVFPQKCFVSFMRRGLDKFAFQEKHNKEMEHLLPINKCSIYLQYSQRTHSPNVSKR